MLEADILFVQQISIIVILNYAFSGLAVHHFSGYFDLTAALGPNLEDAKEFLSD